MNGKPSITGPVPQGQYQPAKRQGDWVFTSGMTPRRGGILTMQGPVSAGRPLSDYQSAVVLACTNAVEAIQGLLAGGETIGGVLSMTVFIAGDSDFQAHSRLADFASEYLFATLGQAGIGARAAVGVATLPGNAPVEIQLIAAVTRAG
ncbi:RidA family protein [Acerihabitans sp.]|uniref:RidA family protein n=1 Tax=Acerihabitans sp. TaxID=2811394 RepID=UPI002EDB6ACB